MSELRNIWIVSNYYSLDNNMKQLMQLISWTFIATLTKRANIDILFPLPAKQAHATASACSQFLQSWMQQYYETRATIEKSNAGSRWEFNRQALFADVEHCIKVYNDFVRIFQILLEFENLFGMHLKSLIVRPSIVDNMIDKLNKFKSLFMDMDFDIFCRQNVEYWDAVVEEFESKIKLFESDTNLFINECVELLRCPANGIELMKSIRELNTRQCFVDYLLSRCDNVVKILISYIGNMEHEFMKHRKNPPIGGSKYKFIASIIWVRSLSADVKANVVVFHRVCTYISTIEYIRMLICGFCSFSIKTIPFSQRVHSKELRSNNIARC